MNDLVSPATPVRAASPSGLARALRRPSRRALYADVLLWALLAVPVVFGGMLPVLLDSAAWWAQVVGLVAVAAGIAVSRRWPVATLLLVSAALPLHGNFVFALPVAAYLTGRRTGRTRPVLWSFAAVLVGGAAINLTRGTELTTWFPLTVWLVLVGVLPWLGGRYWRQYQELLHAGWQRAEQLEREQQIITERERLRERARIAQDMHDSLGHELALIAVRAGALQVAAGLDERQRAAAAELRAGAAEATDQLREIIGVLREEAGPGAGPAPVRPVGESIAELVDRAGASGIAVRLVTDDADDAEVSGGAVAGGREPVALVGLAAHRVVQEAITNAAKHAPGAAVTVGLALTWPGQAARGLRVRVTNEPPPGGAAAAPGGGSGLMGLAERVRLVGGTLRAGATPDGGFQVVAELPQAAAAGPLAAAGGPVAGSAGPSESALRLEQERRQVRRGLLTVVAVPTALLVVLGAVMVGYHVYVTLNSVVRPADFAALRVGDDRARVEAVLPRRELVDSDAAQVPEAEPAGADCRYYRTEANPLGLGAIYRLCLAGDRLVAKDAYRAAGGTHWVRR